MNAAERPPVPLWRTFVWAGVWFAIALAGLLAVFVEWPRVTEVEPGGRNARAFVALAPVLALAAGALCLVLALRRIPRALAFNARYSPPERRELRRRMLIGEAWVPLVVIGCVVGVLWLAGLVGMAVVASIAGLTPTGFWVLVEVVLLFAALWIPILWVGLARRAANRLGAKGARR